MADAGRTVSHPSASNCRILGCVLATHAKGDSGAKLTGTDAETWIRQTAAAFVRACPDPGKRRSGYSAYGLQAWLDDGRPSQAAGGRGGMYGAPVVRAQPGAWSPTPTGPTDSFEDAISA